MDENNKNIDKLLIAADEILHGKPVSVTLDTQTLTALKQLLHVKADTPMDPQFKKQLGKLIQKNINNYTKIRNSHHSLKETIMKYFLTFLTGTFATAIIAVIVLNNYNVINLPFGDKSPSSQMGEIVTEGEVKDVSQKDFGDVPSIDEASSRPQSGGGSDAANTQALGIGGGGGGYAERSFIPPYGGDLYPPETNYNYTGNQQLQIPSEIAIYKTIKTSLNVNTLVSLMGNFGFPIEAFMKGNKLQLEYLNFRDESGTSYNVDFNIGQINFYTYRDYGNNPKQPAEKDIPQDAAIISIANSYLQSHGIDPASLNAPIVDKQWYVYYLREKEMAQKDSRDFYGYIPRDFQVIYPMMIDGIPVVNYGGTPQGDIMISVDILDKVVTSGNIFLTQDRERTQYPSQNFDKVLQILKETGGTNGFIYGPRPLTIDAPGNNELKPASIIADYNEAKIAYLQHSTWVQNTSSNFFIPVVMFKGEIKQTDQEPYEQYTFVPIVSSKEF
jgi:hypothetical protein